MEINIKQYLFIIIDLKNTTVQNEINENNFYQNNNNKKIIKINLKN